MKSKDLNKCLDVNLTMDDPVEHAWQAQRGRLSRKDLAERPPSLEAPSTSSSLAAQSDGDSWKRHERWNINALFQSFIIVIFCQCARVSVHVPSHAFSCDLTEIETLYHREQLATISSESGNINCINWTKRCKQQFQRLKMLEAEHALWFCIGPFVWGDIDR